MVKKIFILKNTQAKACGYRANYNRANLTQAKACGYKNNFKTFKKNIIAVKQLLFSCYLYKWALFFQ